MKTFPVLDSILSAKHLALYVKEKYNLGEDTSCNILRNGINHSYLISDNNVKYVFRVYSYNWRSETDILEEIRLLNLLKENNIPVSFPLPDISENYIQKIQAPEGLRYAVLFSFAEGDKLRNLTENNCYIIGSIMARFHKVSIDATLDRIKYEEETLLHLPYQYAKEHFSESLEEMAFVQKAANYISSTFQQTDPAQLRYGTVHLDMWYDNMSIDKNSNITIFDFDFCGNGWLLLDIAYCAMQLFHTEPDEDRFKQKLTSFFGGYEKVTSITNEEKKLLPLAGVATWIFYLGVQSRRFDNWSNIFLTKNYLKHYIGMAKSWLDYNGIEI